MRSDGFPINIRWITFTGVNITQQRTVLSCFNVLNILVLSNTLLGILKKAIVMQMK